MQFLQKFFPVAKFMQLIKGIWNFTQYEQESLSEACEWFKGLQMNCSHHGYSSQRLVHIFYGGLSQHNKTCLDVAAKENLMHKLTNATVEIIEAMVSNAYNGIGDTRILKRPTGVHLVEASSSSIAIHQKLDVLAKQMEILTKAQI